MNDLAALSNSLRNDGGRILIIQTAFIGDVILSTSLIGTLRNHLPKVKITALTIPGNASILENQVDTIIKFDKHDKKHLKQNWIETILKIRDSKFDVALIPHRSFRSGLLANRGNIPVRIGFSKGSGSIFHTTKIKYEKHLYECERNLKLLEPLEVVDSSGLPLLIPAESDNRFVMALIRKLGLKPGKYAVFAPGSIWYTKRWVAEYYRKLAGLLQKEKKIDTVVVGGKEDSDLGNDIVINREFNLSGKLSLMQSAALIRDSAFLIAGDSAPTHLATAVRTNQIIIFGSTSPKFGFAPNIERAKIIEVEDLWCRPCTNHGRKRCPLWTNLKCMRDITPEHVFRNVEGWI